MKPDVKTQPLFPVDLVQEEGVREPLLRVLNSPKCTRAMANTYGIAVVADLLAVNDPVEDTAPTGDDRELYVDQYLPVKKIHLDAVITKTGAVFTERDTTEDHNGTSET